MGYFWKNANRKSEKIFFDKTPGIFRIVTLATHAPCKFQRKQTLLLQISQNCATTPLHNWEFHAQKPRLSCHGNSTWLFLYDTQEIPLFFYLSPLEFPPCSLFIYVFIYLSIYLFIYLLIYLFIYLSIYLFIYLFIVVWKTCYTSVLDTYTKQICDSEINFI